MVKESEGLEDTKLKEKPKNMNNIIQNLLKLMTRNEQNLWFMKSKMQIYLPIGMLLKPGHTQK